MENSKVKEVKEKLLKEDQNFRELAQQHKSYEQRLTELSELTYPNDDEILEENAIKRKKLAIKDEMYTIINNYENSH